MDEFNEGKGRASFYSVLDVFTDGPETRLSHARMSPLDEALETRAARAKAWVTISI